MIVFNKEKKLPHEFMHYSVGFRLSELSMHFARQPQHRSLPNATYQRIRSFHLSADIFTTVSYATASSRDSSHPIGYPRHQVSQRSSIKKIKIQEVRVLRNEA